MRQWNRSALVQIMVFACSAPSHYLNQQWVNVNWTLRNKFQWSFNQNIKIFIYKNSNEIIVCKIVAILSRRRWVKLSDDHRLGADQIYRMMYNIWFNIMILSDYSSEHMEAWTKWLTCCRGHFSMHVLNKPQYISLDNERIYISKYFKGISGMIEDPIEYCSLW